MYALVNVDDILLTGICSTLIHNLIDFLHATFVLMKSWKPEYFLGVEVKHLPIGCMFLTQPKCIRYLLT